MNAPDTSSEEPTRYVLRLQERAVRDINLAYVRFAELTSLDIADVWRTGLHEVIAGLATNPRRYPVVPERFNREVRHVLYRRPGSQTIYRILFTITNEQEDSEDVPTVTILHVRHAASHPITRREVREIGAGD